MINLVFAHFLDKRKKSIKHSQSEINNAVLTAQNGYMTRNKLKKQLTSKSIKIIY